MTSTTKKTIDDATPSEWDKVRGAYVQAIQEHVETSKPNLDDLRSMVWGDADVRAEWAEKVSEGREDKVNNPSHYNQGGIECIDYIEQQLGEGFIEYCEGNVHKYLHRWRYKNGSEDLRKALWYLERMLTKVEEVGE